MPQPMCAIPAVETAAAVGPIHRRDNRRTCQGPPPRQVFPTNSRVGTSGDTRQSAGPARLLHAATRAREGRPHRLGRLWGRASTLSLLGFWGQSSSARVDVWKLGVVIGTAGLGTPIGVGRQWICDLRRGRRPKKTLPDPFQAPGCGQLILEFCDLRPQGGQVT